MIDNRLVEDVQLKLQAASFLRAAARPHLRSDPAADRRQPGRQSGDAAAAVRGRRGDEGGWRPGLSRAADRIGRGGDRRARLRADRSTISRCSARLSASAATWSKARSTRVRTLPPSLRSSAPRPSCTRSPRKAAPRARPRRFAEATKEALEMAERALNSGGHLSGITTGLDSLNAKIGGLHKSDLIILAGRPGMGKSSLATNIAFRRGAALRCATARTASSRRSRPARAVAFFSLEMSADQLATRILAEQSRISSENLRMGKISQQEFRQLARAAAELQSLPLYIDDTPGLTIAALAHPRAAAQAAEGHRPDRRRLSPAAAGHGQERQRQPRPGNLRDQPRPEEAGQGAGRAGDRAVAAQPRGRAARGQAAAAVRPARIGLDRAGRRHRALHLSRGLLSRGAKQPADDHPRVRRRGRRRWSGSTAAPS